MDYPVWHIPEFGGGLLIAIIAVVHVYVAHLAVGGGLFLVLTERKGLAEKSDAILAYCKKHTKFFLLLTMVFGSLTGVAIWFIIGLTNPTATLTLIHTYGFAWATEWVFFLGEIVALLVYYYTFGKMNPRDHQTVGYLYFFFGFSSLFMISAIIGSMLTPGDWLETQNFWDGFFNPSFWPSLFFRAFLGFSFAGLFGFFTASFSRDPEIRDGLARYNAKWTCIPLLLMVPTGWWYFAVLPQGPQAMILGWNTEVVPFTQALLISSPAILALALLMTLKLPPSARRWIALLLLILGQVQMGGFEYTREIARKPYVLAGHTYSNQIHPGEIQTINEQGWLKLAKWVQNREISDDNRLAAGRELFYGQCFSCHSIGGVTNDILPRTAKFSVFGLDAQLDGQGKIRNYMPPFAGTGEERLALASYIVLELHGGDKPLYGAVGADPAEAVEAAKVVTPVEIPAFDKHKDDYVLLAWNNLGMHCISDSDRWWTLLPPANDLFAQLVRRGDVPELVTEGVTITYEVEQGFENSSEHVEFWDFVEKLFGKALPKNVGLAGKGLNGDMDLDAERRAFHADLIPVVPYPDGGGFNPYPLFTVKAVDTATGKVLATTRMVAPTTTEMGCRNCHGGEWRVKGVAGFTGETSRDVLAVHDRINKTDLLKLADQGDPVLCQSCHADPVLGTEGNPELLNFPAALHGWHANYLTGRQEDACAACHPNDPVGPTRCLRGVHDDIGVTCVNCHGTMEDHALSLLKPEAEAGKKGAARLMQNLAPRTVDSLAEVNGRTPWLQEPDCLNCHVGFEPPETMDGFNTWTADGSQLFRNRSDDMGALMCEACHGSTHAIYPAREDSGYGANRDNIGPMQYMGQAKQLGKDGNCNVCHLNTTYKAADMAHHPAGFR
ncbi:MAG: cytochrome ubiquinol oxidase subunit I [Proteobacteria bacterium]|nr:cytochrome ubiquinol oxidase subunit I [Pseudomonadota bacterium]